MADLIERQAAIDALDNIKIPRNASWYPYYQQALTVMSRLPSAQPEVLACGEGELSAQPERLTNDDFETIRIHLSAYKERLCNQSRWKEAEEYQRIIDRFMSFASAQPEPQSPCDLCVHNPPSSMDGKPCCMCVAEPWRGEEHGIIR